MIVHVYSVNPSPNPDVKRRQAMAERTWALQHWKTIPIEDSYLPRLFNEHTRKLPYVKDLLNYGCDKLAENDIVVFTNSDIYIARDGCTRIALAMQNNDAAYAFRRDFYHTIQEPVPDSDIGKGVHYPGSDLYAFRCRWWRQYRDQYPDMVFSREAWDCTLRVLMEQTCPNKPVSIPDLIYHERHANGWEASNLRYSLGGQKHNLHLARMFLKQRGLHPEKFGIQ